MLPDSAPASSRSGRKPSLLTRINQTITTTSPRHHTAQSDHRATTSDPAARAVVQSRVVRASCHPKSPIDPLRILLIDVDSGQLNSSSVSGTATVLGAVTYSKPGAPARATQPGFGTCAAPETGCAHGVPGMAGSIRPSPTTRTRRPRRSTSRCTIATNR